MGSLRIARNAQQDHAGVCIGQRAGADNLRTPGVSLVAPPLLPGARRSTLARQCRRVVVLREQIRNAARSVLSPARGEAAAEQELPVDRIDVVQAVSPVFRTAFSLDCREETGLGENRFRGQRRTR